VSRRARVWGLAFLAWTLLGLTYTGAMIGRARLAGPPIPWDVALGWNLSSCYLWMLLSPIPIALARWVGFEARAWRRALAVHVPTALILALVHHFVYLTIYWQLGSPIRIQQTTLAEVLRVSLPWRMHDALVVYTLLVLCLYVLHHVRAGEAERGRRSKLESQLVRSRLEALRMQLQPHFLFNTLNSISALVLEDPKQAKAMIAKLGDFLRLALEAPRSAEVPVHEELRFLEGYLAIQRLRFQDRLTVSLDVAEDTLNLPVPHLVLQPLVENALRHGLSRRPGPAALEVRSRREGEVLLMEVEDNGVGLPPQLAEGVGLTNTRARLRVCYGDAASLELSSRAEGGVLARLRLPVEVIAKSERAVQK
jgi:two-component system, LytTR family, sensor kinase